MDYNRIWQIIWIDRKRKCWENCWALSLCSAWWLFCVLGRTSSSNAVVTGGCSMLGMGSATFHSSKDLALLGSGSSWREEAMVNHTEILFNNFIISFQVLEFVRRRHVNQTFSFVLKKGSVFSVLICCEEVSSAEETSAPGTACMENGCARGLICLSHLDPFLTRPLRTLSGKIANPSKISYWQKI